MKKAVIVGCNGQDGRIAHEHLLSRGYAIVGIDRDVVRSAGLSWNIPVGIGSAEEVFSLLKELQPDEIYYFAAYHHSSQDAAGDELQLFAESYKVNVLALVHFLEGIRRFSLGTRLFYAASSLIFGDTDVEVQDEQTPFSPNTVYAITKLDGLMLCRYYRQMHGLFASTGIFYNHESPYRSDNFISAKIVQGALDIQQGRKSKLVLGDLSSEVDWGYAPDYVDAAHRIVSATAPDEFIIASGKKHTVQDFVQTAFEFLGLDWKGLVEENRSIITRKRRTLIGNPNKLIAVTGWQPTVDFREMIRLLLIARGAAL